MNKMEWKCRFGTSIFEVLRCNYLFKTFFGKIKEPLDNYIITM